MKTGTGNKFGAEEFTTDAAGLIVVTQAGSASGSASVLNGVTTTIILVRNNYYK